MAARPACDRATADVRLASSKGFTLLELVVSMLLLAVIIAVISGAIRPGCGSVDSGEKTIGRLQRQRMSLVIIDSQIQSGFPLARGEQGAGVIDFKGERGVLAFASNYSIWDGERGFVQVTYRVVRNEKGKQVLYASENTVGAGNARETKLLDGFDEIHFEYFMRDPATQGPMWTDMWTDDRAMPQRVAVHLTRGDTKYSFIIPIRADGGGTATQAGPRFM